MLFVAGAAAGIAFIFACGHMNAGTDASASPADCTKWQVEVCRGSGSSPADCGSGTPQTMAPGWEPFAVAYDSSNHAEDVFIRRCAP
jgi:hypothetical protein